MCDDRVHQKNTNTQSNMLHVCSELHDAIFVVGGLDEMLMLRGMRYHPIDIENSVVRSHRNICEWSATVTASLCVISISQCCTEH